MSKHLCECSECGDEYPFRALIHSELLPGFLCPKCKELEDRQIDNEQTKKEWDKYETPMHLDDIDDGSGTPK